MTQKEKTFIKTVWEFYHSHGRHTLPWRLTSDPYLITVSEIMLQQTQVDRVLPKYEEFVSKWPTASALAHASLSDVLTVWQGLGYNRRAKYLQQCATQVAKRAHGRFPTTYEELLMLPGIGPYTAGAVCAFAYNQPIAILETNIKTVFMHHFFTGATDVADADILRRVQKTLDHSNPRAWYWALMDHGAYLKKTVGNNIVNSATYTKQTPFKGSDRQLRGAIIRTLSKAGATRAKLLKEFGQFEDIRVDAQLSNLTKEGMIVLQKRTYTLPR